MPDMVFFSILTFFSESIFVKKYITLIFLAFILFSKPARAVVCSDPGSMIQQLTQYQLDISQWAQEYGMMKLEQELQSRLAQVGIQSDRELSSNEIARTTEVDTQIYNKQHQAEMAPVQQACDIVSASESIYKAKTKVNKLAAKEVEDYVARKTKSYSVSEYDEMVRSKVSDIVSRAEGGGSALRGDVVMGIATTTFDKEQAQAVDDFISIVSGELESQRPPEKPSAGSTKSEQARYASYIKDATRRSIIVAGLQNYKSLHMPVSKDDQGNPVSKVGLMENFVEGKFGGLESSEFISLVTNTHNQKNANPDKFLTTEAQVARINLTLEAFSNFLDFEMYKQNNNLLIHENMQTSLLMEISSKLKN